jgi:hypothetical protein
MTILDSDIFFHIFSVHPSAILALAVIVITFFYHTIEHPASLSGVSLTAFPARHSAGAFAR